jgi:hypothetical protein
LSRSAKKESFKRSAPHCSHARAAKLNFSAKATGTQKVAAKWQHKDFFAPKSENVKTHKIIANIEKK